MLELSNYINLSNQGARIPDYVNLESAIPAYSGMSAANKEHYKSLYLLACHTELLQELPQDIQDLEALVYFIFYHHLAYLPSGKRIYPMLPFGWSQSTGLSMEVITDRSKHLLPALSVLAAMPVAYFTALMLGFALFQRYDPKAPLYHLLFQLLESLLSGRYSEAFAQIASSPERHLKYGWFFQFLPRPEKFDFSSIFELDGISRLREVMVGTVGHEGAVFHRPQIIP